jgi:PadR family transcriptional regulator, regulatory protein PadR
MYSRGMYSGTDKTMDINKDLVAATATPLVLSILAEGDSYGYAILKRVSELSGGELEWTDGMLYPVLHRLERQGHIKGKWGASETGRKRKYYHLTARGRAQLAEQRQQWQMMDSALRNVWPAISLSTRLALSPLLSRG